MQADINSREARLDRECIELVMKERHVGSLLDQALAVTASHQAWNSSLTSQQTVSMHTSDSGWQLL